MVVNLKLEKIFSMSSDKSMITMQEKYLTQTISGKRYNWTIYFCFHWDFFLSSLFVYLFFACGVFSWRKEHLTMSIFLQSWMIQYQQRKSCSLIEACNGVQPSIPLRLPSGNLSSSMSCISEIKVKLHAQLVVPCILSLFSFCSQLWDPIQLLVYHCTSLFNLVSALRMLRVLT